jgi:DNA primase
LIAAAVETIERIGPCDAKVEIEKIDDIRSSKREFVLGRAKELLGKMSSVDTREMETELTDSVRTARIIEYGDEKLPAGPDMDNEEVIVVEGRADVLNLLKYGIKNVIAMNGASLPKTIAELGKIKKLTMFIDGDRGGILNAKDAVTSARIEYVAQAPAGKEVEELSGKEINTCLRAKVSADEFKKSIQEEAPRRGRGRMPRGRGRFDRNYRESREEKQEEKVEKSKKELSDKDIDKLRQMAGSIEGTKAAFILDSDLSILRKTSLGDIAYPLRHNRSQVFALLIDGTVTNFVVKIAEETSCKYIIAKNFAVTYETNINLISI